jgi:branched-chain amino acid transport system ATP-binding protein
MHPRRGSIRWNGQTISDWRPARIVAAGIAQVPEGRQVFPKLSVAENLRLGGYRRKAAAGTLEWVLEMFPRLAERSKQAAGTLSGGEQQMLAIGRGLMSGPELLMIDELSLGLAPIITEELFKTVRLLREAGTSLLLVEQHVSQALAVADRVYVLNRGSLAFQGSAEEAGRPGVLESSYMGSAALHATAPA